MVARSSGSVLGSSKASQPCPRLNIRFGSGGARGARKVAANFFAVTNRGGDPNPGAEDEVMKPLVVPEHNLAKVGVVGSNPRCAVYCNCVEIEENVVLSLVPMPFTAVIMTTAMPAAIRAYSMEVAPESSLRNARNRLSIRSSVGGTSPRIS